ncbi:alpha-ketoglutarate-dependent dioxygenase AlkB [Winogradskyella sp. 3972H.M.0a.05]|uniref:alpha-ketoglutarate-dependent dioxygenase AlkB family protein n=1 Tax=Winogradskyella sp. 3972H.M.0a.05 TaxID=2950277 RepID=UPI00339586A2
MNLFSSEIQELKLPNAELIYVPRCFSDEESEFFFNQLRHHVPWQQDDIKVFGKVYAQPRLTALYGESDKSYSYSGITMLPHTFTNDLMDIKNKVETFTDCKFSTVLLNLYRDGSDSNGWHADNEKELGNNPVIASVSFGAPRWFHFKHRTIKTEKHKILLESGSLLIMKGEMQHHWLHQIPKTKKPVGERINLTFRKL